MIERIVLIEMLSEFSALIAKELNMLNLEDPKNKEFAKKLANISNEIINKYFNKKGE